MMNIRHLEILEAISQEGTFTGAARKLNFTQSAVSHAMAELERQAGTALFERLPKGVRLTPCGRALLEESRGVLAACRSLELRISCLEENTPVNIVSSITAAAFLLPQILVRLQASFPELRVNVHVASANSAMNMLRRGEADIAFWEGAEPRGPFQALLLGSYRLCAACAPEFPLKGQAVSPRTLCGLPLLLREPGSAVRDTLDSALALENLRAYPIWESVNSFALIKAAEAGLGITVLPEMLLEDSLRLNKLRIISLECLILENRMLAVLHKDKYITRPLKILLDDIGGVNSGGRLHPQKSPK